MFVCKIGHRFAEREVSREELAVGFVMRREVTGQWVEREDAEGGVDEETAKRVTGLPGRWRWRLGR